MLSSTDPDILVTEKEAPEQGEERNYFITALCNSSRGQDDGFLPGEVSGPKRVSYPAVFFTLSFNIHHSGYLYSIESYPKIQQLRTMNLWFLQIKPRSGSVPLMRFPSSQKLQSNESLTGAGGRERGLHPQESRLTWRVAGAFSSTHVSLSHGC